MSATQHPESKLRNIGVVAHINAGKTTLTERILFDTGKQRFMGDVDSGTATMDWMVEEHERGISINAGVTCVQWQDHNIHLIDTPGHVDFTAEVERCLRVLDGAVVLLDGVRGVESQTEAVWSHLERLGVPRIVFVNKLDREASNSAAAVRSLAEGLGCRPVVLVHPVRSDHHLIALIDVISGAIRSWQVSADSAREPRSEWRLAVTEACADLDPSIMADYVDGRPVEDVRLHAALRAGTLAHAIVPVFAGAALHNLGVDLLLDGICRYLPSPVDRMYCGRPTDSGSDQTSLSMQPFAGLVFKVQQDDGGRLGFVRVYRGTLRVGDVIETGAGEDVRAVGLWQMHAMYRDPLQSAGPGQLVAVEASRLLRTGETLRARGSDVVLEPVRFSAPVLSVTVEPRASADMAELECRARAMVVEDPTLRLRHDETTGVLQVSGMGELHLEVFASRLNRVLPHPARFGQPAVARFETVAAAAEQSAECFRTVGESRFSARARVRVGPAPGRGAAVVSWSADASGIPPSLRAEILEDLRRLASSGIVEPFPARDMKIDVLDVGVGGDGEMAETLVLDAVSLACRRAVASAGSRILEPLMRFELECPADTLSLVMADLRSKTAEFSGILPGLAESRVEGTVPLARVIGYATALRSMTRGKGRIHLALERFAPTADDGDRTVAP